MSIRFLYICFVVIVGVSCYNLNSCPKCVRTVEELGCVNKEAILRIRIQGKAITSLDVNMFEGMTNVDTIDVSNNQIADINPNIFKSTRKIIRINLIHNCLRSIQEDTFGQLEELRHLHLSNNLIETVHPNAFYGFLKIQLVELKNNHLYGVANDAFRVNSTISTLSVRGNYLTNVSFVSNLYNLSKLDCISNRIQDIPEYTFENVRNLRDLQCMNNRIQDLAFLRYLNKLVYLDLSNNSVSDIQVTTFRNLKNLEVIIMSNNKIELIPTGAFAELKKLKRLVLNNNNLMTIGEVFDKLQSLKILSVMNNQLQQLSSDITNSPINFTLYIDGNKWSCQFIKNIAKKSLNQIKYTPQNNVTNYNNISCMDKGFKITEPVAGVPIFNNVTTLTRSSPGIFETYALPFLVAITVLLGVCGVICFAVILIKQLKVSNSGQHTDIVTSTANVTYSYKDDSTGYLEPRQMAHEEAIYEEIDPMDDKPCTMNLVQISTRKNDYVF